MVAISERLAPAIAAITLAFLDHPLGLRATVRRQRAADVLLLLELTLPVPADVALVALVRLDHLTWHMHLLPEIANARKINERKCSRVPKPRACRPDDETAARRHALNDGNLPRNR